MPDIPGRMKYHGYISPAPPKGAPKEVKTFMAREYGGLRESKYPGEIKGNKQRAARITWYQTKRKFGKKYPELFRKNKGHMKRDPPVPESLRRRESQIRRGARMEYHEHPEFGKKAARQIAIDHILKDPTEYSSSNKILKPILIRPAATIKARKTQARDLRSAAREQRRLSISARAQQNSQNMRALKLTKSGHAVAAKDLKRESSISGLIAKERGSLAHNYDIQAARIETIKGE